MERLNWALLGLMGVVTALGLTTSSGAGKSKSNEQPVSVVTTSNAPACDACRIAQAEAALRISANPIKSDEPCPGNCQATGVCCDKSLSVSDTAVTAKTETSVCEGECCLSKKATATATATTAVECPLAMTGEGLLNLTKNFVCEGGECLTKQGHGTLTITAVDPASAQPEGLSNLLAAAEAVKAQDKPAGAPICKNFTVEAKPALDFTTGTLTINGTADAKGNTLTLNANAAEAKPAVDNSRAAARAEKLAQLEKKLAEKISINLNQNKLDDLVEQIRAEKRIEVLLDLKALKDIDYDANSPFDYVATNVDCGEILRTVLNNKQLTWIIPEGNDYVLITSQAAADSTFLPRVYDVSDLFDESGILLDRIQAIINPDRWKANGGQGDLAVWQSGEQAQLAVNCDYWTHRKLHCFFEDLRVARASSPKRLAQAAASNVPLLRTYELPSLAQEKDATVRAKQYSDWKGTLQQLLRDTQGFDPSLFEPMEFGNRTVLITKQLPAVHHEIERVFGMLKQNSGFGGCSSIIPVVGSNRHRGGGLFQLQSDNVLPPASPRRSE